MYHLTNKAWHWRDGPFDFYMFRKELDRAADPYSYRDYHWDYLWLGVGMLENQNAIGNGDKFLLTTGSELKRYLL